MVWGVTYLFPASMRGLYSTDKPEDLYGVPSKKKEGLTDLYGGLYEKKEDTYNPYSTDIDTSDSVIDESDVDYDIYL